MQSINHQQFTKIETKRLVLRYLKKEDIPFIIKLRSNEIVNKHLDRPSSITPEEADNFIEKIVTGISKNDWLYWTITLKESSLPIGTICLWNFSEDKKTAETGYELLPDFHGKGIMSEALSALIEVGFNRLYLDVMEAYPFHTNEGSIRLLEKFGFTMKENLDGLLKYVLLKD